jgi:hypothetical protein
MFPVTCLSESDLEHAPVWGASVADLIRSGRQTRVVEVRAVVPSQTMGFD